MYFVVDLWMVGLRRMPHSNQDTQTSIESYHGALKRWFSLETKGLRGRQIDWLVWRLMTTVVRHYMHTAEMKKREFIKNKVVERIVKTSVEKATLILHTNVTHGIDDSNETAYAWMVRNQQHPNMTYKIPLPFTKYACCTCEWALRENLCKHQVAIFLTFTDLIKENIIQYCGTWYESDHGGFAAMFADPTYLHIYDNEYDDEEVDEYHSENPWVVDMCELMRPNDTSPNVKKEKDHNQPSSSSTSMEKTLARMGDIMQEIINEVKGGVQLIDHTTSLLCIIAIDVQSIHLSNEVKYPDMVFHCVNAGLGDLVHWMKDWHETMLEHGNIRKMRACE